MKPLFAVIVTYRRFDHFRRTIESLAPTLPAGSKLIVLNNGYDAETTQYMRGFTAPSAVDFEYVPLEENKGWAAAMNKAFLYFPEWEGYEYVLESNNDVEYESEWFEKARSVMEGHPEIGILGLWKHPHHGTQRKLDDGLLIKDNMPATAWLFRSRDLEEFLPFKERGACKTRGGNGEDTDMVLKVQGSDKWVCGMDVDLAHHLDGYDTQDLGKPNAAYN